MLDDRSLIGKQSWLQRGSFNGRSFVAKTFITYHVTDSLLLAMTVLLNEMVSWLHIFTVLRWAFQSTSANRKTWPEQAILS
jgi:hypothetical protein